MKKHVSLFLLVLSSLYSFSQTCLPDGITFISQAQVDSFQINHPSCSIIEGSVTIGPENSWDEIDISNLDSLIVLTTIEGNLKVWNNDLLANLSGLDSLSTIEGDLLIETNSSIENLVGLENITNIGGMLRVYGGNYITNLNGLDNLTTIGGNLVISYNNALTSIESLSDLTSINGEFIITSNASLASLSGLNNIEESSITSMVITSNANLSMCSVESVCAYLAEGSWGVNIANNASGCDNVSQVNDACLTIGVDVLSKIVDFAFYPNPVMDMLYITSTNGKKIEEIQIFNQMGQKILYASNSSSIDVSDLTPGLYIVEIKINGEKQKLKIVRE